MEDASCRGGIRSGCRRDVCVVHVFLGRCWGRLLDHGRISGLDGDHASHVTVTQGWVAEHGGMAGTAQAEVAQRRLR